MSVLPLASPPVLALEAAFISWLLSHGGSLHPSVALRSFEGMGRGLIALEDIPEDTQIFTIPRQLLLNTSTSLLPSLLPAEAWSSLGGWSPLILILMYESIRPSTSSGVNWAAYFALMPTLESFDTLMFWNEVQLKGLEGSSVLDKIGREEAEEEYTSNVLPFILAHPGVFGSVEGYGMERFHWCGSLVLSRSFHVESGEDESEDEEEEEEDEETEDVGDVAMVPMADLLNAMSGKDNARLFYAPLTLSMQTTAMVPANTQIFNTYASPPNSDLLRRYGHVDAVNEEDVVEVEMELVMEVVGAGIEMGEEELMKRIDWWSDLGGDECFSLTLSLEESPTPVLPDALISFLVLLLAPSIPTKESLPKPRLSALVAQWGIKILEQRLSLYPTTSDDSATDEQGGRRREMARVVVESEKRILSAVRDALKAEYDGAVVEEMVVDVLKKQGKRERDDEGKGRKKARVSK